MSETFYSRYVGPDKQEPSGIELRLKDYCLYHEKHEKKSRHDLKEKIDAAVLQVSNPSIIESILSGMRKLERNFLILM